MTAAPQAMQRPRQILQHNAQELQRAIVALQSAQAHKYQTAEANLQAAAALAESLNPYGILSRGYAVVERANDVCTVEQLQAGDSVTLRGAKADAKCTVQAVHQSVSE